jgi:hypothetical protein
MVTDDTPANECEATADNFQWVFELEDVQSLFGQRVSARLTDQALRDLTVASFGDNATEVRLAWHLLLDTMGPVLTSLFIRSNAWRKFCPEPDHDAGTPSLRVVWRKGGKQVVARLLYTNEVPTGVRCDLE